MKDEGFRLNALFEEHCIVFFFFYTLARSIKQCSIFSFNSSKVSVAWFKFPYKPHAGGRDPRRSSYKRRVFQDNGNPYFKKIVYVYLIRMTEVFAARKYNFFSYICIFFRLFSIIGYYKILTTVPRAIQ